MQLDSLNLESKGVLKISQENSEDFSLKSIERELAKSGCIVLETRYEKGAYHIYYRKILGENCDA